MVRGGATKRDGFLAWCTVKGHQNGKSRPQSSICTRVDCIPSILPIENLCSLAVCANRTTLNGGLALDVSMGVSHHCHQATSRAAFLGSLDWYDRLPTPSLQFLPDIPALYVFECVHIYIYMRG